jgi:alanine racemase
VLTAGLLEDETPDVVGAAAYGLAPGTRPVLTLIGEVVAVKRVGADAGVSYGYSYRTTAPTTLALIALGYADGVPRLASSRATVQVGSGLHPLVGRVAMDQFVVDCGDDVPELGSDAVLFGDPHRGAPSALDWATATERTPLDLTAGLGQRIAREAR